ncbi:unnamed protein product [Spirodela intermedia]|uniref:Homeobox domain-containing protein n=1 Tax=Spirodela intermedia TaxID=51605 RepID=A0A7I8J9C6_SPIIN|nr:unnamed protein product [Spirodela intermedia]CAA6666375.1 unnamed protein product [Spirodela intermedia]
MLRLAAADGYPFSRPASSLPLRFSRPSRFSSLVACARRGGKKSSPTGQNGGAPRKAKKPLPVDEADEEDIDEDAFEALFSLLEEDLKKDNLSGADFDDEISEEDLERLERELAAALDEDGGSSGGASAGPDDTDDDDEDDEDLRLPKLKNWQLRRLASALKIGRRKTNIKALSAELGLERAVVLECLRDPLRIFFSWWQQDASVEVHAEQVDAPAGAAPAAERAPVHAMKASWAMNKRLKKVQVETLERVYARARRPTNTMISSIVHTTNLPWKTVVKWFEDKRVEDGEPERRQPFRRSEQGRSSPPTDESFATPRDVLPIATSGGFLFLNQIRHLPKPSLNSILPQATPCSSLSLSLSLAFSLWLVQWHRLTIITGGQQISVRATAALAGGDHQT